jgi:hypothetical protein
MPMATRQNTQPRARVKGKNPRRTAAAIAALAAWANISVRTYKLPVAGALLVFGSSLALTLDLMR